MSTDESGYLVGIRYHDGRLLGVNLRNGDKVVLTLASVDGDESRLELRGIDYLTVNDFREGNTINAIYVWDRENIPRHIIREFSAASSVKEHDLLNKIESVGYKVFYLECSYGAEIFATIKEYCLLAP